MHSFSHLPRCVTAGVQQRGGHLSKNRALPLGGAGGRRALPLMPARQRAHERDTTCCMVAGAAHGVLQR